MTILDCSVFLAPGSSIFELYDHGFDRLNGTWLLIVVFATGAAGWNGLLPGTERTPYILRFDEDRPNQTYRRICYAFVWNAVPNFASHEQDCSNTQKRFQHALKQTG